MLRSNVAVITRDSEGNVKKMRKKRITRSDYELKRDMPGIPKGSIFHYDPQKKAYRPGKITFWISEEEMKDVTWFTPTLSEKVKQVMTWLESQKEISARELAELLVAHGLKL